MFCTRCGQQLEEGARYCPYCGEKTFNEEEYNHYHQAPIYSRSIPVAIILSIVTFGIYGLYWLYALANDLNTLTNQEQPSGFKVLVLTIVTLGFYELYWLYKAGERINEFQMERGIISDNYRSLVYLILGILGWNIIAWAFIQNDLNKYAYDS